MSGGEDLVQTIRDVFCENIDDELIKSSLTESNGNVLNAIKLINKALFASRAKEKDKSGNGNDCDSKSEDESILNTLTIEEMLIKEQKGLFKHAPDSSGPSLSSSLDANSSEITSLKKQLENALERNKELETLLEEARTEIGELKEALSSRPQQKHHKTKYPFVLKGRWVKFFSIHYEWKYPPTMFPSTRDCIELHIVGQRSDSCVDFSRATGSGEGSGLFKGLSVGFYVLKYVINGKPIAVSDPICVGDEVPVDIEMDTTNNVLNVMYSRKDIMYASTDNIVLYSIENEKIIASKKISISNEKKCIDGKILLDLPKVSGSYEVRYYIKDSKAYSGMKPFIIKNEDVIDVCLIPAPGTTFARVMWKCKAFKRSGYDWIGLYNAESPASYRCYDYAKDEKGSVTFDLCANNFRKGDTIIAKFFVCSHSKTEPVMSKEFVMI